MLGPTGAAARPPPRPVLLPRPSRRVSSSQPAAAEPRSASPTRRSSSGAATATAAARPPPPPQPFQRKVGALSFLARSPARTDDLPPPNLSSELACPHFGACAGCVLQSNLADPPSRSAAADWFADRGSPLPPPPATAGPPHAWRSRARLAVRPPPSPWWDARPAVGLFQTGTHVVYDIVGGAGTGGGRQEGAADASVAWSPAATPCRAHHPRLNAAAAAVSATAARLGTAIYTEPDGGRAPPNKKKGAPARRPSPPPTPGLRYLQLTAVAPSAAAALARPPHADPGATVQAVLVWGGSKDGAHPPAKSGPAALAAALWAEHGPGGSRLLHSIALNYQPHAGNAILGPEWEAAAGDPDAAWQVAGAAAVSTPPAAFCQANPGGFGRLLSDAGRLLDGSEALRALDRPLVLADLFAGAGAVGLGLAARGLEAGAPAAALPIGAVRAVDVNAAGGPALAAGAAALAARFQAATAPPPSFAFVAARAGEAPGAWLDGADAAVVDPPRRGLDAELAAALAARPPPSLAAVLYISCHFPSLARDGDALLASGRWRLSGSAAHVLFPGADAVEAVALFERVVE